MTNKEKGRKRKFEVRVKLTEVEWQYAKDKSKYLNRSMSEMIRRFIMDGVIVKYEVGYVREMSDAINKVGVNINQIARCINEKGGEYDRQDMESLISEFQNMQEEIYAKIWGIN